MSQEPRAANRLGVDYALLAEDLSRPVVPILDAHTHINGIEAAKLYREVMDLFGIDRVWSMTRLETVEQIQTALDGRLRPIAIPDFAHPDPRFSMGPGYIKRLPAFRDLGARLAKFWCAPRTVDIAIAAGDPCCLRLDSPIRLEAIHRAIELGMGIMVHVADPDTWFRAKYADERRYGTKRDQYEPLEAVLESIAPVPLMAAHMGGWPEDLEFLSGLLRRHPNLFLDTSAAKWMIRELSRHRTEAIHAFFEAFGDRVLFGSDNVTMEEHLGSSTTGGLRAEMTRKASSHSEAFDLYASRYAALRTLFETKHVGESPIADPDLAMEDPARFGPLDAPTLAGKALSRTQLKLLYRGAAEVLDQAITATGSA